MVHCPSCNVRRPAWSRGAWPEWAGSLIGIASGLVGADVLGEVFRGWWLAWALVTLPLGWFAGGVLGSTLDRILSALARRRRLSPRHRQDGSWWCVYCGSPSTSDASVCSDCGLHRPAWSWESWPAWTPFVIGIAAAPVGADVIGDAIGGPKPVWGLLVFPIGVFTGSVLVDLVNRSKIEWFKRARMTWRLASDDRARACRWFRAHCSPAGTDWVADEPWLHSARWFVVQRMRLEAGILRRAAGGDSAALDQLMRAAGYKAADDVPAHPQPLTWADSASKTPIFEEMRRAAAYRMRRKGAQNAGSELLLRLADSLEKEASDDPEAFDRRTRAAGFLVERLSSALRGLREADAEGGSAAVERLMAENDNGIWETARILPFVSHDPFRAMLVAAAGLRRSASLLEKMWVAELQRLQSSRR